MKPKKTVLKATKKANEASTKNTEKQIVGGRPNVADDLSSAVVGVSKNDPAIYSSMSLGISLALRQLGIDNLDITIRERKDLIEIIIEK